MVIETSTGNSYGMEHTLTTPKLPFHVILDIRWTHLELIKDHQVLVKLLEAGLIYFLNASKVSVTNIVEARISNHCSYLI